jgi:4-amino-4-deoxy-L-arabinose transferase-like glycosyltransferase
LGLALRLGWVLAYGRTPPGFNDPAEYLRFATSIATGHGYTSDTGHPTAYYPVGYPAFVAAIAWPVLHTPLRDHVAVAVEIVQAFLSAATVVAMAIVARAVAGRRAAVATAALLALWPNLVFHSGVLLGETLCNAIVASALAVLLAGRAHDGWPISLSRRRLAIAGLLLGVGALVRPTVLLAVPVLAAVALAARLPRRAALAATGVVALAAVAVLAPWTVRNAVRLHAFVPISTNTGDDLCIGRYPGAVGWFAITPFCQQDPVAAPADVEVARDRRNTRLALDWTVHDPLREMRLVGWRATFTYTSDHDGLFATDAYGAAPQLTNGAASVLGTVADDWFLAGLVLAAIGARPFVRDGGTAAWFVLGTGLVFGLVPLAFFGDSRFHVPAVPLLALPAGVALARLAEVVAAGRAAARVAGAA